MCSRVPWHQHVRRELIDCRIGASSARAEPDGLAVVVRQGLIHLATLVALHFYRVAGRLIEVIVGEWKRGAQSEIDGRRGSAGHVGCIKCSCAQGQNEAQKLDTTVFFMHEE